MFLYVSLNIYGYGASDFRKRLVKLFQIIGFSKPFQNCVPKTIVAAFSFLWLVVASFGINQVRREENWDTTTKSKVKVPVKKSRGTIF